MAEEGTAVEAAPAIPAGMLSSAWGTILTFGGLVLTLGSLTYAVVEMQAYESEIAELRAALGQAPLTPAPEVEPEPTAPTPATPTELPTVVVTETATATATPAPPPRPIRQPVAVPTRAPAATAPAGGATADRTRALEARIATLSAQLETTQAQLDEARRQAAASADEAKQCNTRLTGLDQTLARLRAVCDAASTLRPGATRN